MWSHPSAASSPRATIGPRTRISPSAATSSSTPRSGRAGAARHDLGAGLGHPVDRHDRNAGRARPVQQPGGHRSAAQRDRPQPGRAAQAGRAQPDEHRRHQRGQRHFARFQGGLDPLGVEAVVEDHRRRVDHAANQHVQAADVMERQRAQPPIVRPYTERVGRRQRAGRVVGVGQLDRLGDASGAGGADHRVHGVRVEARTQGSAVVPGPASALRCRRTGLDHRTHARERVQQLGEAQARRSVSGTLSPARTPAATSSRARPKRARRARRR